MSAICDPSAREADPLEDMGDILLVARQPVEGFGDDDSEPAFQRILQQLLDAEPDQARARYAVVAVIFIDRPAFSGGTFAADPVLILDRSFALQIRRVAGIDGGGAHRESFVPFTREISFVLGHTVGATLQYQNNTTLIMGGLNSAPPRCGL
jgi:hypothetical protein